MFDEYNTYNTDPDRRKQLEEILNNRPNFSSDDNNRSYQQPTRPPYTGQVSPYTGQVSPQTKDIKEPVTRVIKVPTLKGLAVLCLPVICIILIVALLTNVISNSGVSKTEVNTAVISVGELQTVYTAKGFFYGKESDDLYYVAFIDDDYAEHGIEKSTKGTITNPTDNSTINLVVISINDYDSTEGSENILYKTLLEVFETDNSGNENEITEESEYAEGSEYGYTSDEVSEEESTEVTSDIHHVVVMAVSKDKDTAINMQLDQFVDVTLVTYQNPSAYSVPTSAVVTKDGVSYILAVSGSKVKKINVSIGVVKGDQTEIIAPELSEGKITKVVSKAISSDISSIEDGTKIKIVEPEDE